MTRCEDCSGAGYDLAGKPCATCRGAGEVPEINPPKYISIIADPREISGDWDAETPPGGTSVGGGSW